MRFNPAVDIVNSENNKMYGVAWSYDCHMTGYEPTMMICMPMKVQKEDESKPEFIGVAVACDKINGKMWVHTWQYSILCSSCKNDFDWRLLHALFRSGSAPEIERTWGLCFDSARQYWTIRWPSRGSSILRNKTRCSYRLPRTFSAILVSAGLNSLAMHILIIVKHVFIA